MQTRAQSFIEVFLNTTTGFVGSWFITFAVLYYEPSGIASNTTVIVFLCTLWSLLRGIMIRRLFNSFEPIVWCESADKKHNARSENDRLQ